MEKLIVDLGTCCYPIYIGHDVLDKGDYLVPYLKGRRVLVVTNETVGPLYAQKVCQHISSMATELDVLVLPDGEQYKTAATLDLIYTRLLEKHFDRGSVLVALGGGVVGDMVGYAAATYQRGIDFIQIPTTLLAQVDSSVGGKTAINHPLGKNMIGAFYQPRCVLADTATLLTLPPRELRAGLAEVIKYGVLGDVEFFTWLESHIDKLLSLDANAIQYAITRSCTNKIAIVAADEREQGNRALLNLGHTFGHAIETYTEYKTWLHGEAVAVGMVLAAGFSVDCGCLANEQAERIMGLLQRAGLPISPPDNMTREDFLSLMQVDKKVFNGVLRLVLLKAIGSAFLCSDYPRESLLRNL